MAHQEPNRAGNDDEPVVWLCGILHQLYVSYTPDHAVLPRGDVCGETANGDFLQHSVHDLMLFLQECPALCLPKSELRGELRQQWIWML